MKDFLAEVADMVHDTVRKVDLPDEVKDRGTALMAHVQTCDACRSKFLEVAFHAEAAYRSATGAR